LAAAFSIAALTVAVPAAAKDAATTIVIHAGKQSSPNHTLARQFAEAVALAGKGAITTEVRESQGSVQNVMDAARLNRANYVFTASPSLIAQARRGEKPFHRDKRYQEIRALFPIPYLTLHWAVRQDSGIKSVGDLAGHSFVPGGKGSFSEHLTATALQVLDLDQAVKLIDIDAASAPAALLANKVSGLALAGFYPMPSVLKLASATPIRLIGLSEEQAAKILKTDDTLAAVTIPKGTYPKIDADVTTLALPAGAYTTQRMSEATAYAVTKAFWSQRPALAKRNPPWQSVSFAELRQLGAKLHKGALRYYLEAGVDVPAALR
jgi:TRAP transporter TAXI family solute receptor